MPNELPEDIVGQGKNQENATGEGIEGEKLGWRGENQGEQGQQRNQGGQGQKNQGGQGQKNKGGQGQRNDPNREPGDQDLYNEDNRGNVFYDKNTEIKRETEFHDATAAPLGNEPKVTQENDQFGKEKKK